MPASGTPRFRGFSSRLCSRVSGAPRGDRTAHSSLEKGTCSSFGEPEGLESAVPVAELAWEEHCEPWSELLQTFTMQVTLTWVPRPPGEDSAEEERVVSRGPAVGRSSGPVPCPKAHYDMWGKALGPLVVVFFLRELAANI